MIFYFSGTGNSHGVAEELAIRLHDEVCNLADVAMGMVSPMTWTGHETLGFVFPVYGWRPPSLVREAIRILSVSVPPKYLFFICTCGDDTGKTSRVFSRWLDEVGLHCDAGFSVTMPNTYVCLPGFDVDSKAVERQKLADARKRIDEIVGRIRVGWKGMDCHEGGMPWLKTYVLYGFFSKFLMSAGPFHATADCISCGKCEVACPLHNVKLRNGRPEWGRNCAMCLSCYHHCPKHAVAYRKLTLRKGQYVFPIAWWKAEREQ